MASTSCEGRGQMVVVDADCVYGVVARTQPGQRISQRLASDDHLEEPHIINVEVRGVIRRFFLSGQLDATAAFLAVAQLENWDLAVTGPVAISQPAWLHLNRQLEPPVTFVAHHFARSVVSAHTIDSD